ncbi:MAG: DUF4214 domain-containing protein [Acidimicrobiia bacterium]
MLRRRSRSSVPTPSAVPAAPAKPVEPQLPPRASDELSSAEFVRFSYNLVLDREPDDGANELYIPALDEGRLSRHEILDTMRHSMEFRNQIRTRNILISLHLSRCDFIRSLPRAKRILDLGGTHQSDPSGALVGMGYPYEFDELIIVDLPHDDRHDIYTHSAPIERHESPMGLVRYEYHSMVDLSRYEDASFDLVYSGQTIEHVTPEECDTVLAGVMRVLKPGGWFCLDTPNGPVCRLQQGEFINPDHKVEYGHEEFSGKLRKAGFNVREEKGLNWAGKSIERGWFSVEEVAWYNGVYGTPAECYLLAYCAQKP